MFFVTCTYLLYSLTSSLCEELLDSELGGSPTLKSKVLQMGFLLLGGYQWLWVGLVFFVATRVTKGFPWSQRTKIWPRIWQLKQLSEKN